VRAFGLVLLAFAAVWPARWVAVRVALGAAGGGFLVASAWPASFGSHANLWAVPVAVALAAVAVVLLPALPSSVHRAAAIPDSTAVAAPDSAPTVHPSASAPSEWALATRGASTHSDGPVALAPVAWHSHWWRGTRMGWGWGWRWALLAGSAAAVYGCVPETDQMREVGVVVVAGAVVEVVRRLPLPAPALVGAWGLVAWSALYGATGRPSALIGGLFALVAPVAAGLAARRGFVAAFRVGGVWAVAALVVARTGGIEPTTRPAVVAALVGALVAAAVSALVWRRSPSVRCDD